MKKLLTVVLAIHLCFCVKAQNDTARFVRFSGLVGQKVFNPWAFYGPIYEGSLYFPNVVGGEIYFPEWQLSLDGRQEFFVSLAANNPSYNIALYDKTSIAGITCHFGKKRERLKGIRTGAGYLFRSRKDLSTYGSPVTKTYHGFTVFIGIPLDRFDLELRAEPDQQDIISGDKFSLQLLYRFGAAQKFRNEKDLRAVFLFGIKASGNRYYKSSFSVSAHEPVAVFPEYGFDFYWKDFPFFLDLRRSVWIGVNAGYLKYDINGYIEYLHAGIGREIFQAREWNPSVVLSHVWGRDLGVASLPSSEYHTEKGVGLTLVFPVRKVNIEARTIIPYHFPSQVLGPKGDWIDRSSIGIVYPLGKR